MEVGAVLHLGNARRRNGVLLAAHDVEPARPVQLVRRLRVLEERQLDFAHPRRPRPVVGVRLEDQLLVVLPFLDLERSRAIRRLRPARRVGRNRRLRHHKRDRVGQLRQEVGQVVVQRDLERPIVHHLDAARLLGRARRHVCRAHDVPQLERGAVRGRLRLQRPVDRVGKVLRRHRRPVGKLEARPDLEGVGLAVLRHRPRLCPIRHHVQLVVQLDQPAKDQADRLHRLRVLWVGRVQPWQFVHAFHRPDQLLRATGRSLTGRLGGRLTGRRSGGLRGDAAGQHCCKRQDRDDYDN